MPTQQEIDDALHAQFYKDNEIKVLPKEEFLDKAGKLGGWFLPSEGQFLMDCVKSLNINLPIIEIGSYVGKTTSYFSRALLEEGRDNLLFSLDPFIGSREHQTFKNENTEGFNDGTTFGTFVKNLKDLGVYENVVPIAAPSDKIAKFWDKEIRILFIDGDHNHDQPMRDYSNFSPFIIREGYLIFHDSTTPDVILAIEQAKNDGWNKFYENGVLTAWKRF